MSREPLGSQQLVGAGGHEKGANNYEASIHWPVLPAGDIRAKVYGKGRRAEETGHRIMSFAAAESRRLNPGRS